MDKEHLAGDRPAQRQSRYDPDSNSNDHYGLEADGVKRNPNRDCCLIGPTPATPSWRTCAEVSESLINYARDEMIFTTIRNMVSSAQQAMVSVCPRCGASIKHAPWVFLNVGERPDLVVQIGSGDFNRYHCEACTTEFIDDYPLLMFFPGAETPFLYSPAAHDTEEEARRGAAVAERFARRHFGGQWQERWTRHGLLGMPRERLVREIGEKGVEGLRHVVERHAVEAWLMSMLREKEGGERRVIEAHPDLLTPLCSDILRGWIKEELASGNVEGAKILNAYLVLLVRCRIVGIDAAVAEWELPNDNFDIDRLSSHLASLIKKSKLEPVAQQEAIATCRTLLTLLPKRANDAQCKQIQGYLGWLLGTDSEEALLNLESAIASRELVEISPDSYCLFIAAYGKVAISERDDANLERAIASLDLARSLSLQAQVSEASARASIELVRAYALRTFGDRSDNYERALSYGQAAGEYFTLDRSRDEHIRVLASLANIYFRRVQGERTTNIETAIRLAQEALEQLGPDGDAETRAELYGNLGNFFAHRSRGDAHYGAAMDHYQRALEYYTRERNPWIWARLQLNLGHIFLMGPRGSAYLHEDSEAAITCLESAVEVRTRDVTPEGWATTKLNLVLAYANRTQGDTEENLAKAIASANDALQIFTPQKTPLRWAQAHVNLAGAYLSRTRNFGIASAIIGLDKIEPHRLEAGLHHLREAATQITSDRDPEHYSKIQEHIADVCVVKSRWDEAHAALQEIIKVGRKLFAEAYTDIGRLRQLVILSSAYAEDAYCLYEMGDASESFLQMERGKAWLLREWLRLAKEADSNDERGPELVRLRNEVTRLRALMADADQSRNDNQWLQLGIALKEARAQLETLVPPGGLGADEISIASASSMAPEVGAMVAPLITRAGTLVFVIRQGMSAVQRDNVVALPDFGAPAVNKILYGHPRGMIVGTADHRPLEGWLSEANPEQWAERIQDAVKELGRLMTPVMTHLESLGILADANITIMPQDRLGLLPLWAARVRDGCFLDEFTVSFTPGSAVMATVRKFPEAKSEPTLLAVVNPTGDLAFAELEGQAIATHFEDHNRLFLSGSDAILQRVIDGAQGKSYLHLSCHGLFRWDDVTRSGVLLAGGELLTLAQVVRDLDLRAARLVVLSACSTAQTESEHVPNEFFGLPTAFLQAGAKKVICTLWPVDDVSTALLMQRFYDVHLKGTPEPDALRTAQLWLRDVPAGELAEGLHKDRMKVDHGSLANKTLSAAWRRFLVMPPDHRPFQHPFFWAPFTLYTS